MRIGSTAIATLLALTLAAPARPCGLSPSSGPGVSPGTHRGKVAPGDLKLTSPYERPVALYCGPRPSSPGVWRCVPPPHRRHGGGGGLVVNRTFRKISGVWVKGGKSFHDNWSAGK